MTTQTIHFIFASLFGTTLTAATWGVADLMATLPRYASLTVGTNDSMGGIVAAVVAVTLVIFHRRNVYRSLLERRSESLRCAL